MQLTEAPGNMHEVFQQFWNKMNLRYVYWDKDTTRWDAVYAEYEPLFRDLSYTPSDLTIAVSYFREMLKGIIDGHFRVQFHHPLLAGVTINPASDRMRMRPLYHENYDYVRVVKSYLDPGYVEAKGSVISNGARIRLLYGTIDSDILYLNCNFFALKKSYDMNDGNEVGRALSVVFSILREPPVTLKGIILDLRANSGGDLLDLNFIAGKLTAGNIDFGYTRSKSGFGRLDYLPWVTATVLHDPAYQIRSPIMILGDNYTASLSEIFIVALKARGNVLFIGERTYGATGPLSDPDIFNGGSFEVGEFMTVETSSVEFRDSRHDFLEGKGLIPDIDMPFNYGPISMGIDRCLETAVKKIKE